VFYNVCPEMCNSRLCQMTQDIKWSIHARLVVTHTADVQDGHPEAMILTRELVWLQLQKYFEKSRLGHSKFS
jgi:hypothetical protein